MSCGSHTSSIRSHRERLPGRRTANGVFTRNRFIDDSIARTGLSAAALPSTGALYTAANWRPFGYGGILGQTKKPHTQRERFLITAGLNGEFGGEGLSANGSTLSVQDYSAQFNEYISRPTSTRTSW